MYIQVYMRIVRVYLPLALYVETVVHTPCTFVILTVRLHEGSAISRDELRCTCRHVRLHVHTRDVRKTFLSGPVLSVSYTLAALCCLVCLVSVLCLVCLGYLSPSYFY